MGHDIYANNPHVNDRLMRDEYRIDDYDDDWPERFDKYQDMVHVAYLRRNAFNPANSAIYILLDAMEHYGGCSGTGGEKEVTREDVDAALDRLKSLDSSTFVRERNMADDLLDMFSRSGLEVEAGTHQQGVVDLEPERKFLERMRDFFESDPSTKSITVSFG